MSSNEPKKILYWEHFVNALAEAVLVLDLDGGILYANQSACCLFDKSIDAIIGSNFSYPIQAEEPIEIEIFTPSRGVVYADVIIKSGVWQSSKAWVVTLHDITERKEMEKRLEISANVFNFAKEGIVITDLDNNIIDVNKGFECITGYSSANAIGKKISILKSDKQDKNFYEEMWAQIKKMGYWSGEIWNKKKNGGLYLQLLTISEVRDKFLEPINYIGIFYDITQQQKQKTQLQHITYHDPLTDLPNRLLFTDRLETIMQKTQLSHTYLAVAFIDLDDFKSLNDRYGHAVGDLFIKEVADVLNKSIRSSDILARYGSDEFLLLMPKLHEVNDFKVIIENIYSRLSQPIQVDSLTRPISVSVGVSVYPQKTDLSPEQLIRQADQAMYISKISGKGRYTIFNAEIDLKKRRRGKYIDKIQEAFANDEMRFYYMPKVNMKNNAIFGAEGLIRWQHSAKGLLLPEEFLPYIKHQDLSLKLTKWTIISALNQLKAWHKLDNNLTISVNIDAFQIEQYDFIGELKKLISPYGRKIYQRLELEILESSVISNMQLVYKMINECNKLGIDFSLDDFGTGYSSITYLVGLPFKYVKIDMNFVRNILNNERDIKILKAMLEIADTIGIEVIAEGVETQQHIELLKSLGCYLGQGYAFSKALPAEKFVEWYHAWKA